MRAATGKKQVLNSLYQTDNLKEVMHSIRQSQSLVSDKKTVDITKAYVHLQVKPWEINAFHS